jgi:serine/threonine-protein kinase
MTDDRVADALALFQRAIVLPREEQESVVTSACGEDVELRERVLAMLRADSDDTPLIDATPNELASALSAGPPPALEGRRIGPYRIISMLGRGGMGVVYLAQREDVQKLVALKIVAGGLASPERVARFVQERRVLAQLEHPHIARLLDAGVTEDGTPWFAMDYVPGKALDVYCDAHSLSIDQRLQLFERVCGAVAYAHQHLVVHRDLKPSNILVTVEGEPRLVDFGIAKLLAESNEAYESLTAGQSLPLTPQYASPEQIRGETISTASDIYQLGALLFELLTGRPPHPERFSRFGDTSADVAISKPSAIVQRDLPQELKAIERTPLTTAQIAGARGTTPERLRRRLAGDLDTIVARATQLEPQRRYATTEQLADDIRRHREGLPVQARPTSAAYRFNRFVRRHRAGTAVASVAGLTLLVFAATMARQNRRIEAQRVRAEHVSTLLSDLFAGADPTVTQGETVTVASLLDRGSERIRQTSDPEVKARLLSVIARAYSNLGQHPRTVELDREVVQLMRSVYPKDHPALLEAVAQLSASLLGTGARTEPRALMDSLLPIARALPYSRRYDLAGVLKADGLVRQSSHDHKGATAAYEEALAILKSLPDSFGVSVEETLVNLGYVREREGDIAGAEKNWREVLERRRTRLGSHSLTAKSMLDLSGALVPLNKLDEAEQLVGEAVAIQKKVFRGPHGQVAGALASMAEILGARDKLAEAESAQREALAMIQQLYGRSESRVALANLAGYVQRQGRFDEADQLQREALQLYLADEGERTVSTAIVMTNVAFNAYLRRRFDESDSIYRRAIPVLDSAWAGTASIVNTLLDFALVQNARDNCREGERHARRAYNLALPANPNGVVRAEHALGACLTKLGRYAEAETLLVDAHDKLTKALGPGHQYTRNTAAELVLLYDRWKRPEKANLYRVSSKDGSR